MAAPGTLRLQLLGPLALARDGVALPLATHKLRALLALLALGGRTHRARIAEWLWPGLDDGAARRNLRRELARLRSTAGESLLQADGELLALAPAVAVDAQGFDEEIGDHPEQALARWAGPPLDGLRVDDASSAFADWLDAQRRRLLAQRRRALQACVQRHQAEPERALAFVEALLADDPLQEQHQREAMQLLARLGRREAALARFEACRELLLRELGLAPMPETTALALQLRQGPATAAVPAAPQAAAWPGELPLVGRDADWAWLAATWDAGTPILIEGEAGVGKTRLAREFAASRGAHALAQCRSGDADAPYSAFVRALRLLAGPALAEAGVPAWAADELAHVLPELGSVVPRVASAEDRSRLQEAAVAAWTALAGDSFDAVLIDDWHLADAASRALFARLAAAPKGVRLVLLLRPELDEAARHALQALRREAGAMHRQLAPLDEPALQALVQRLPGQHPDSAVAARLLQASGGNAFYATETLRHWQAAGLLQGQGGDRRHALGQAQLPAEWPLPPALREAVLARVQRLPAAAQRVLEAASLASEPFVPALLAGACALSEVEALDAIEQALAAQLLRETGTGYAFAHDLVQWALDGALPADRRRLVHRRLALGAGGLGLAPADVARHWELGGEPARAVASRLAAAQAALSLGAFDAAELHWQAARADGPSPAEHLALLEQRTSHALGSDDRPTLEALRAELDAQQALWSQRPETAGLALRASLALAHMLSMIGESAEALWRIDALMPTLPAPEDDRGEHARALEVRSQALNVLGRNDEARADCLAALALPGLAPMRRAALHHSLVFNHFLRGEPALALPHAERSLAIWRACGARRMTVKALANIGMLQGLLGDQPAAITAMQQALAEARSLRLIEQQRLLANNLSDSLLTLGRAAEVIACVNEAMAALPHYAAPQVEVFLRGMLVQAHYQRGELDAALAQAETALARALQLQRPMALLDCASMALDVAVAAGDTSLQARLLAAAEGLSGEGIEHFALKFAFNRVRHALAHGDLAAARVALQPVADIASLHEVRDRQHAAVCQAELRLAEGDASAALAVLATVPMDGAHVEVAARAELAQWQALQALQPLQPDGRLGQEAHATWAALRARRDDPSTPVPMFAALDAALSSRR